MKIFGTDYDGTLLIDNEISPASFKSIEQFRNEGNIFGIVTGRSYPSMQAELAKWEVPIDFLITNNGGQIMIRNQLVVKKDLDFSIAQAIIEDVKASDAVASFVMSSQELRTRCVVNPELADYKYQECGSFCPVQELLDKKIVSQIVVSVSDLNKIEALYEFLHNKYATNVDMYLNHYCIDIVPKNINKALALKYVADHYNIDESAIYSCGDAQNDYEMLACFKGYWIANERYNFADIAQVSQSFSEALNHASLD